MLTTETHIESYTHRPTEYNKWNNASATGQDLCALALERPLWSPQKGANARASTVWGFHQHEKSS